MQISLNHASNENHSLYCEHGAEHQTFEEAIQEVMDRIRSHDPDLSLSRDQFRSTHGFVANRYVLTTNWFDRETKKPNIINQVEIIEKATDRNDKYRKLRQYVQSEGIVKAMLVAIYAGFGEEDIRNCLLNKQFMNTLNTDNRQNIIFNGKEQNLRTNTDIRQILRNIVLVNGQHRSFSPTDYWRAIEIMRNANWITEYGATNLQNDFTLISELARAKVVISGADEIAQRLAPKKFIDPERSRYIEDKYGKMISSKVVTAYLEFTK